MKQEVSTLVPQLEALGFDQWEREDLEETIRSDGEFEKFLEARLHFLRTILFPGFAITLAIDELGNFWAAEGYIDLRSLGFTELHFDENGSLLFDPPTAN